MQSDPAPSNPTSSNPTSSSPTAGREIALGLGLLLLLHTIQIPLGTMTMGVSLFAIGLSQLLYVIPAVLYYRNKQRPGMVKGLLIGAALTLLLNGTCTAIFFWNPPNFH